MELRNIPMKLEICGFIYLIILLNKEILNKPEMFLKKLWKV